MVLWPQTHVHVETAEFNFELSIMSAWGVSWQQKVNGYVYMYNSILFSSSLCATKYQALAFRVLHDSILIEKDFSVIYGADITSVVMTVDCNLKIIWKYM